MKILTLAIIITFFFASNALACDEEAAKSNCSKDTEKSWNPSSTDATDRLNRFYSLEDLISEEYEKGNYEASIEYINEYLELASIYKKNWNFGNAIHDSYRYLGLISYKKGDLDKAAKYLVKSGKSTGSPQLNTFGPELDLANLLLQEGKVKEVTVYLKGIKRFWEMDNGVIDSWLEQIDNGGRPELSRFGNHRMSLIQKVINWFSLLWPAIVSFILYFIYRSTLSILKFIPTCILSTYAVVFSGSFSSYFLFPPIAEALPAPLISLTLYILTATFSFILPGVAAFYLTKVRFLHIKKGG